jgi:hypothetical protein
MFDNIEMIVFTSSITLSNTKLSWPPIPVQFVFEPTEIQRRVQVGVNGKSYIIVCLDPLPPAADEMLRQLVNNDHVHRIVICRISVDGLSFDHGKVQYSYSNFSTYKAGLHVIQSCGSNYHSETLADHLRRSLSIRETV